MIKILLLSFFILSCSYSPFSKNTLNTESHTLVTKNLKQISFGKIPVQINKYVLRWVSYYQGRGYKHMRRYLERSHRYQFLMQSLLRKESVPIDLIYVPLIESGFASQAHSHASAVGYWQFIKGTALRYGLQVNDFVDDRKDPVLSTKAAIKYFKALHNMFDDWYLGLAAYNSGENRIKRYIKKYRIKNYWTFVRRRILPRETRNYVPKFLAALLIAKNPEMYGFYNIKYHKAFASDYVKVNKSISLKLLSKEMKISFAELRKLNPRYLSDWVPVKKGKVVSIRVPKSLKSLAARSLKNSYSSKPLMRFSYFFYYKVRRGDTLSYIARKFKSRVSSLVRLNNLRRRHFLRIGQKLKIRRRTRLHVLSKKTSFKNQKRIKKYRKYKKYKKRKLSKIKRHKTQKKYKTQKQRKLSSLKKYRKYRKKLYKIKQGDTLTSISKKFRTSNRQLRKKNRLGLNSKIITGRYLIIPR